MTDLLGPDDVREIKAGVRTPKLGVSRLCRDYLTLWDRWTFAADTAKSYMRTIKRLDATILELEKELEQMKHWPTTT